MTRDAGAAANAFAAKVRAYLELTANAPTLPLGERLRAFTVALAELVALAAALPETEPGDDGPTLLVPLALAPIDFGRYDPHAIVFDPYAAGPEGPVVGSLDDDVRDVARDLARGLAVHARDPDAAAAAIWVWRFHFHCHWGQHATSALYALRVALGREAGDLP